MDQKHDQTLPNPSQLRALARPAPAGVDAGDDLLKPGHMLTEDESRAALERLRAYPPLAPGVDVPAAPKCDRCNDTGWHYSDPMDPNSLEPCCDRSAAGVEGKTK